MIHLDAEINELKEKLGAMWELVSTQLDKTLTAMNNFDKDLALRDAQLLELLAKQQPGVFLPDTAVGNSRSKPEIWKETDKFKAASMSFQNEATRLVEAARSGNIDAFKGAVGAVAKTCDTCHDNYRSK